MSQFEGREHNKDSLTLLRERIAESPEKFFASGMSSRTANSPGKSGRLPALAC